MRHGCDVENSISGGCGSANRRSKLRAAEQFLLFVGRQNVKSAASCAQVNLSICHQWRGPDLTFDVVRPKRFSILRVDTMKLTATIGDEDHAVVKRRRRKDVFLQ